MIIYVQITYILFIKNAHYLYPHQKYRFIPNKQGQLLCTSCTSLKKNQQKNRIHMDSPVLATYPQKKRLKGPKLFFCVMSFPAASSLYCSSFSGIFEFKKWTWCVLWNQRPTRFDNKKQKVEPTNIILKQIATITPKNWGSCLSNHPSTILPFGDFIANPVPHRAPLLDSSVQQGSSRSSREVLDSEEGWPGLWAAAMLPDQPSHHCVHSSPLATKVSSIVMVDHYLSFLMIPSYQLWVF